MKKFIKSFLALLLVFSLLTPSVFAEEKPTAKINKEYKVGENIISPEVTFKFAITPENPNGATVGNNNQPVKEGVPGLLTLANEGKLTFNAAGSQSLELKVNKGTNAPGVYRYKVTETAGTVEGLTYNQETKEYVVDLYLYEDGTYSLVATNPAEGEDKTDLKFVNVYAHKDDPNNPGGQLTNLKVEKKVEGNLGDKNKEFEFTITITPDTTVMGQQFVVKKGTETIARLNADNNYTVTAKLKDGEFVEIFGLSANDKYIVLETESGKDGYTTTGEVKDPTAMGTEDVTVTVINKANQDIPTGIIENIAPFALVLVAAVAFGFVYFKKRSVEA